MSKNNGVIFGISGKLGSGKDTFAEFLAEELPNRVERHSMADNLRLITEIITGVDMCITHEYGKPFINQIRNYTQEQKNIFLPKFNKTIGETLQLVGTDLLRERYDNDIWVKSLFSDDLNNKIKEGKIIVVPDVRFLNEADYIIDNGGVLIRLEGDPKDIRRNSSRNLNHSSEIELDNYNRFHKVIKNDSGLDGLRKKVIELITEFNF